MGELRVPREGGGVAGDGEDRKCMVNGVWL